MIKFAVIGTSRITKKFLEVASLCPDWKFEAVYSRDIKRGSQFGAAYGVTKIYADLAELASDPAVDAVYIASPNSLHCEQAIQMMKAKKHVLCEKAIASNLKELNRMLQVSKDNNVILLEGMRSVFDPGFQALQEHLHKLGRIRRVTFQYCQYSSRYDAFREGECPNIFNPKFSAGALMDIGVYCVHPLVELFGRPNEIQAMGVVLENGIDGAGTVLALYDGMLAELIYSKITNSQVPSQIQGEKGVMLISEIPDIRTIEIIYNDESREKIEIEKHKNNMLYETQEFLRLIKNGESAEKYNAASIMEMEIMDRAREIMKIRFPADL